MKNCQSRRRWKVPGLLQPTPQCLNTCAVGEMMRGKHVPSCDWEMCPKPPVRHQSGGTVQSLPQTFSFTGSLHRVHLKPEIKFCLARLSHVRRLRAGRVSKHDRGSLWFTSIGPGVTFGKLKIVGYNSSESTGHVTQKGTSIEVLHPNVVRGDWQCTAHLLLHRRCYKDKLACFLKGWEEN